MKANELMQGDIVLYEYDGQKFPAMVIEIYRNSVLVESTNGEYEPIEIEEDKIFPVDLTPKILEKNGFVYKKLKGIGDKEIWRIEDDYYDIDIYEWSDSIWIFRYDCTEMSLPHTQVTMSYVHELQHALRLCGIEKEIKLYHIW